MRLMEPPSGLHVNHNVITRRSFVNIRRLVVAVEIIFGDLGIILQPVLILKPPSESTSCPRNSPSFTAHMNQCSHNSACMRV